MRAVTKTFRVLHLRDEAFFLFRQPAEGVADDAAQFLKAARDVEEVQEHLNEIRRPVGDDFTVAADDDGVGVMPAVAPAPDRRLLQDHEARDLVDHVIVPARLERRAVAAFVPAGIRCAAVEDAVDDEDRDGGPGAPGIDAERRRPAAVSPSHRAVSRSAGPSLRAISSFIRLRGIADAYHLAPARPFATARLASSPVRL